MKRKRDFGRLAPLGIDAVLELRLSAAGLALALIWGLAGPLITFFNRLHEVKLMLEAGGFTVMYPLDRIMGTALYGFYIMAVCFAGLLVWHLVYLRIGARTDYLIRRLPKRREVYIRTLAVPAAGIIISLLLAFLVNGLMLRLYFALTPPEALPQGYTAVIKFVI